MAATAALSVPQDFKLPSELKVEGMTIGPAGDRPDHPCPRTGSGRLR